MILGDLAGRLAPDKLARLQEIRRAYPDTPFEKLPAHVMKEVFLILHTASKPQPLDDAQTSKQKPVRAPVSDVITHLVRWGHTDARVTQFGQGYLEKLEHLITKARQYDEIRSNLTGVVHTEADIRRGRELLNACFYRCMIEKNAHFDLDPHALYFLAVARCDTSEEALRWHLNVSFLADKFKGFLYDFEKFCKPKFVDKEAATKYIADKRKKREKQAAAALVNLITELRYTMKVLAECPIMVDTGQY